MTKVMILCDVCKRFVYPNWPDWDPDIPEGNFLVYQCGCRWVQKEHHDSGDWNTDCWRLVTITIEELDHAED